jgi:hypothetical protein
MGQPDVVFAMQEDYPIPAEGTIDYKWFEVPTNLTEDKWVQAIEIRPGARTNVHHVIAYMRTPPPAQPAAAPAAGAGAAPASAADTAVLDGRGHGPAAHRAERRSRAGPKTIGRRPRGRRGGWAASRRARPSASTSRAPR